MAGGKPFRISIVSDVSDVLRGNKDVAGSLEDVADSLDDVARDAQDAGRELADGLEDGARDAAREVEDSTDKIGRALEDTGDEARDAGREIERRMDDAARDGERSADKLERSFREAFDDLKTQGRTATRQVAQDTRENFDDAERATDTFKDEARSNLSEALSSFRGEVEEIPDLIQGTFGGLVADFGPAGLIGAGLVAAGAGLAVRFYEDWKEQAERVEQRIADMYADMLESGQDFLSTNYLNTQIGEILNSTEDAAIKFTEAQEVAAATGLELSTVVRGYAGEAESARVVQAALNEKIAEANANFVEAARGGNAFGEALASEARDGGRALEGFRDTLGEVTGQVADAAERAEVYRGAHLTSAEAVRDHAAALAEYDDTVADAREQIAENNETLTDAADRARENTGVLAELASEMLDIRDSAREAGAGTAELTDLQAAQAGEFLNVAEAAGIEQDAALELAQALGLIPAEVATDIREQGADRVMEQARRVRETAEAVTRNPYHLRLDADLPTQAELQERLNRLVWGLTAPAAVVNVRYGQNIE